MTNLKKPELHTFKSGYLQSYEAPRPPMPKIEPLLPADDGIKKPAPQDYITKPVEPQSVRGIQPLLPIVY